MRKSRIKRVVYRLGSIDMHLCFIAVFLKDRIATWYVAQTSYGEMVAT